MRKRCGVISLQESDHASTMQLLWPLVLQKEINWKDEVRMRKDWGMEALIRLFRILTRKKAKPPLHTPEELECFKRDALENRAKHYR